MKTIDLNPLRTLLRHAEGDFEELQKLDRIEREAKAVVEKVLEDGNLEDIREQQELSTARLRLDLVPSRRRKLLQSQPKVLTELRSEVSARRRDYNRLVREQADAVREQVLSALAPFYPGARRMLLKDTKDMSIPALAEVLGCAASTPFYPSDAPAAAAISEARNFIEKAKRSSRLIGLQISES